MQKKRWQLNIYLDNNEQWIRLQRREQTNTRVDKSNFSNWSFEATNPLMKSMSSRSIGCWIVPGRCIRWHLSEITCLPINHILSLYGGNNKTEITVMELIIFLQLPKSELLRQRTMGSSLAKLYWTIQNNKHLRWNAPVC